MQLSLRQLPMITNEMVLTYLECPRKAYLITKNEEATITDYELLNRDLHGAIRRKFLQKFSKNCDGHETLITRNLLMQQRDLIQNAKMLSRDFDITYDVLQKISEPSLLGKFSYIPIQTISRQRILKDDKLLIATLSIPLGDIQGKKPNYGRVVSKKPTQVI